MSFYLLIRESAQGLNQSILTNGLFVWSGLHLVLQFSDGLLVTSFTHVEICQPLMRFISFNGVRGCPHHCMQSLFGFICPTECTCDRPDVQVLSMGGR